MFNYLPTECDCCTVITVENYDWYVSIFYFNCVYRWQLESKLLAKFFILNGISNCHTLVAVGIEASRRKEGSFFTK